jgi:hypothetical protein
MTTEEIKKQEEQKELIRQIEEDRFFSEVEREWQSSLSRMSDTDWIEMFPEARDIVPDEIKKWEARRSFATDVFKKAVRRSTPETAIETRLTLQLAVVPRIEEAEAHIRRLNRQLNHKKGAPAASGGVTEEEIQRAREVPIESLLSTGFRKMGKNSSAKCPLHDDSKPSFIIYGETNTCWCFGCQQGGDSITLIKLLQNLSFVEAVKCLNRI